MESNRTKSLKILREPGYIHDLIFIFVYHFNKKQCLADCVNNDKTKNDTEFFTAVLYEFSDISYELFLFFNIENNGKCLFEKYYFEPYKDRFISDYNLALIQCFLLDSQRMIRNVCEYYFPEIKESEIDFYCGSIVDIGKLIARSKYDAKTKCSLYYFFINPLSVIEKLKCGLTPMYSLLEKYYERHYKTISNFHNEIDLDGFVKKCNDLKDSKYKFDLADGSNIYVSVCLLDKNYTGYYYDDGTMIFLLGYDYEAALDYLLAQQSLIHLDVVFTTLAEENRRKILDLLLEKGELNLNEMENALHISGSNAYYHINLIIKADMIKTRNEGKKVLYSLNANQFDAIIKYLSKYKNQTRDIFEC